MQSVQQAKFGHLGCHDIGTCGMGARAEHTGTILTSATGGCVSILCFSVGMLNDCA
jgi:hypothetical protein